MATMDYQQISVVVLNYRGLANTLECLRSLKGQKLSKGKINIVVVDNASVDGSAQALGKLEGIHLITNSSNLGYSGGNNIGIKYSVQNGADLVFILNNDTIVDESCLETLLEAAKSNDIISPKIYFAKNYEFHKDRYQEKETGKVIWYAGGKIDWDNIIGIHIGVDEVDRHQFNKGLKIDLATGAAMLVKKKVFERIGLFDEKYFLYLEDMDFCVRAKKANFNIAFEPKAIVWHKNAGSAGGSGSKIQDYYITRNRLLFSAKYAKLRTKLALLRQIIGQSHSSVKRKALFDFLTLNFGKCKSQL